MMKTEGKRNSHDTGLLECGQIEGGQKRYVQSMSDCPDWLDSCLGKGRQSEWLGGLLI